MLNALRQKAGSWVVKVLLLLLVVSFAIWGVGDIFFGGQQDPAVATVGDSEIPASELARAFDRAVSNLQRQLGGEIDRQRAIQLGVMQQALQGLVGQRLLDLGAQEMGLTVADDTLRQMIVDNPMFQSAGQFDRSRFDQLLRASGLTEDGYLAGLRQEVVRNALAGSIAGPVVAPAALVDALYRYRNEQRRGHYVAVTPAAIAAVPEPSDDDLATFHEAHAAQFTTPEYRALTFISLEPKDLIAEVEVTDADIEAEYQTRIDDYRTPERRTVEQLLAADRETIEQAAKRVAEGASFETVAAEIDGVSASPLGTVAKGSLPAAFDDAIFAQAEGEVGTPVESTFGWHLFRVSAIEPETVVPLAEVRDALAETLALREASDRLPTLATQLDDELAAGTELTEAAATLGLSARSLVVDATGKTPDGQPAEGLPPWPELVRVAFETPAGETSLLEETDAGGYFVVEVDEIRAPRLQPVDEVRAELIAAWQADERRRLARERAEELRTRLDEVASLDQVAADASLVITPIEPVRRDEPGDDQGINRAVVRALFATEPGQHATGVIEVGDGFAVVGTDEVIAADPASDPEGHDQLASEIEANMRADLIAQFESDLRRAYPVAVDGAVINRVIGADGPS